MRTILGHLESRHIHTAAANTAAPFCHGTGFLVKFHFGALLYQAVSSASA